MNFHESIYQGIKTIRLVFFMKKISKKFHVKKFYDFSLEFYEISSKFHEKFQGKIKNKNLLFHTTPGENSRNFLELSKLFV